MDWGNLGEGAGGHTREGCGPVSRYRKSKVRLCNTVCTCIGSLLYRTYSYKPIHLTCLTFPSPLSVCISWDTERASALVRVANPNEDQDSIDSLTDLLLKMRALICKFNLTPCVRTSYTRVALQSASTNKLRLTIDRDVTVINERSRDSDASNSWCLEDHGTIPREAICRIPYCVFEVKVSGSDVSPEFVSELERSHAIIEARKFSKFLSGASIFNVSMSRPCPGGLPMPSSLPFTTRTGLVPALQLRPARCLW